MFLGKMPRQRDCHGQPEKTAKIEIARLFQVGFESVVASTKARHY